MPVEISIVKFKKEEGISLIKTEELMSARKLINHQRELLRGPLMAHVDHKKYNQLEASQTLITVFLRKTEEEANARNTGGIFLPTAVRRSVQHPFFRNLNPQLT